MKKQIKKLALIVGMSLVGAGCETINLETNIQKNIGEKHEREPHNTPIINLESNDRMPVLKPKIYTFEYNEKTNQYELVQPDNSVNKK